MKGELKAPDHDKWYLGITREQFIEIYAGLDIDVSLFDTYPKDDKDFMENYLPSKLWRLNNLYTIVNKDGYKMQFLMNYAQHKVYAASLRHPRIIILKSRQQGISTFWLISFQDDAIFNVDLNVGMLAQGLEEASTLLSRSKLSWENFPQPVKDYFNIRLVQDNTKQMSYSNGSTVFIRTSFRSATLQRLHVSELGKIAAKDPRKAEELQTGTLQAISAGNTVVIESTAEGVDNAFSKMWDTAVELTGPRPPKAFLPVFLSWTEDPDCNLEMDLPIPKYAAEYFLKVEQELGIELTRTQKNFWVQQYMELHDKIGQEYPATPEEAFSSVRDGTYYARMYREFVIDGGREVDNLYDPYLPVYAAMDLGLNDSTVIIFFQVYEKEWRLIDCYWNSGEADKHYIDKLFSMPYTLKRVFLPHDSKAKSRQTNMSTYSLYARAGLPVKVLPRDSVADGIALVRDMIPNLWVDTKCLETDMEGHGLRKAILSYTKQWDEVRGVWKDQPLHNWASDFCDALRYVAVSGVGKLKSTFEKDYLGKAKDIDPDFPDAEDVYTGVVVDGLAL